MKMEMIGIILSNAVLLITAVWRISYQLSKMTSEITHMNEKMQINNSAIHLRLASLEERVTALERNKWKDRKEG